ncbi:DNA mismatch repair protein MutL [Oscillospiraceae bacterium]|nr:DNA mismatch repair protein MutL [Oscillospiraceae bacterium]
MLHIQQLDSHVADLIAAGEVVERPASVVKELVENAIDAQAHAITVEIQNGGMSLIRVTDDGCGIAPGEVETAFLRHATSKIRSEYDLEAIGTLGFRGEALAAIASVARVELLTRRLEDTLGTSLTLEGGVVTGKEEAGCPAGTTLLVRDLFYNTPARLKFMKKDAAEGAACLAAVQRQALAHPEVSFKFLKDGKQELLTPGDSQLRSALYAVLGRDMALGFTKVEGSGEGMTVSGFTSLPACCRGTRGYQFFFVNGRYIKSKTMTAAVEQAYANQRMVGKFPGCVLHLTTKLNAVDVNVHPTKQEVKFGAERQVFSAVYYAVLAALGADQSRPAAVVAAPKAHDTVTERQTSLPLHDFTAPKAPRAWPERPEGGAGGTTLTKGSPHPSFAAQMPPEGELSRRDKRSHPGVSPGGKALGTGISLGESQPAMGQRAEERPSVLPGADGPEAAPLERQIPPPPPPVQRPEPRKPEPPAEEPEIPWRVAGELFRTYILVEQGDKALLIDKHAAHERMNFDRMRAQDYQPMSQELLTPTVFTPAPEEGAALLDHLEELEGLGFEVTDFGGGSLAVRRIPDYVDPGDIEATLTEVAGKLLATGSAGDAQRRDEILHTMACKAAIKGGWKNAPEELARVAKAVIAGEVKYCPHGRPVAIELTRSQLEKQFKRA